MIRGGFLPSEDRTDLIALARDGSVAHRLGRRANALVLLDDGLSCEAVAKLLFVDDDTIGSWLARPGCRIRLHYIPAYCPPLDPIERLWGVVHKHMTHNRCYATCREFAGATLRFLHETVPRDWTKFRDSVTDNFRIISPNDFRVMA
jgi:hypothetical protein